MLKSVLALLKLVEARNQAEDTVTPLGKHTPNHITATDEHGPVSREEHSLSYRACGKPSSFLALVIDGGRANANKEIRVYASTTPSAYFLFPSKTRSDT